MPYPVEGFLDIQKGDGKITLEVKSIPHMADQQVNGVQRRASRTEAELKRVKPLGSFQQTGKTIMNEVLKSPDNNRSNRDGSERRSLRPGRTSLVYCHDVRHLP